MEDTLMDTTMDTTKDTKVQLINVPLSQWELMLIEKALEIANESITINESSLIALQDKLGLA